MGMILRIASSRIVGQGDIVGRSGYFSLNLSANSVMRGRLDARRTLKSLVADLRLLLFISEKTVLHVPVKIVPIKKLLSNPEQIYHYNILSRFCHNPNWYVALPQDNIRT